MCIRDRGKAAEVGHAKDDLVGTVAALEFAEVGENLAIGGVQEAEGTTAEDLEPVSYTHLPLPVNTRPALSQRPQLPRQPP